MCVSVLVCDSCSGKYEASVPCCGLSICCFHVSSCSTCPLGATLPHAVVSNKISDELCDFIGVPHGTEKSRTDITRYINAYVKEHNLNKPTNRRVILPDEKLKKILKINNDEEVTFFILQRLISHHFPSLSAKNAAAAAAVAAT